MGWVASCLGNSLLSPPGPISLHLSPPSLLSPALHALYPEYDAPRSLTSQAQREDSCILPCLSRTGRACWRSVTRGSRSAAAGVIAPDLCFCAFPFSGHTAIIACLHLRVLSDTSARSLWEPWPLMLTRLGRALHRQDEVQTKLQLQDMGRLNAGSSHFPSRQRAAGAAAAVGA